MADKIPFYALVQNIQSGRITQKDLSEYFQVKPNPAKPFDFIVSLNKDTVDTGNLPHAQDAAEPLLRDAGIALQAKILAAPPQPPPGFKRKIPLIAEGDSWFNLPDLQPIIPPTLIDLLQARFATVNLAHWGDTLADMILTGQFWSYLQSGQSDVFLLSGGGNDIIGDGTLWQYINLFDVDHARPEDAPYYLKPELYYEVDSVISDYESLIAEVERHTPHVIMLGHGYDYPRPRTNGPWLGSALERQGIDPNTALARAIIRLIIDAFHYRLKALETAHSSNYKYVDLRCTLADDDWWDELHAFERGANKMAEKFDEALLSLPPSTETVVT